MPECLVLKMGKLKLPSQVGAVLGGAGVFGGAIAVVGLGGGAFVLHKFQQRQQRTTDRDAAMQHAVEKLLWLQAGKRESHVALGVCMYLLENSYICMSAIHSQAAAAAEEQHAKQGGQFMQVQQLESDVQRLQAKVEGLQGKINGLGSQVSLLDDEVKAGKERAGNAHAALAKAQEKKDADFEKMLMRNASLEEAVKQLRRKLEAGDDRCQLNQLEERIAAGKDGPSGGSQMAAGAAEAIAAHHPAQLEERIAAGKDGTAWSALVAAGDGDAIAACYPAQASFVDSMWATDDASLAKHGWGAISDPPGTGDHKTSKPELDIPLSAGDLQQAGGSASSLSADTDELSAKTAARPATLATSPAVAAAEELQQADSKPQASFVDSMWATDDASLAKHGWGAISDPPGTGDHKTSKLDLNANVDAAEAASAEDLLQSKKTKGPANQGAYKQELASSFRRGAGLGNCANETIRQVSLGPEAAAQGLTALGLLTAWDEASKVVKPYEHLVQLSKQGFPPEVAVPGPAVREAQTCVVPFWTKAEQFHIFECLSDWNPYPLHAMRPLQSTENIRGLLDGRLKVAVPVQVPGWGDVNAFNCEDLMAVLPEEHKGEGVNKLDLSLVLLRAAFVVYVNSKLLPWMHRGHDLNMSASVLTKSSLPPTASEACGVVRGVYHRSTDSSSLDAVLAEAGAANPDITFMEGPDQPEADEVVDGHKWQDMSVEQQQAYLDQEGGIEHLCAGSCGKRWHGSNNGPTGGLQEPVEKVVVLRCLTCRELTQDKGGDLPMCEACAATCCRQQKCPRMHQLGKRNSRHRHLPYIALEKCLNLNQ